MYLAVVALLMFVLPLGSAFDEHAAGSVHGAHRQVVRLLGGGRAARDGGRRQLFQPEFTARQIFKIEGADAFPLVREIGAANLALGAVGVASLWRSDFILPMALAAAIFYGIAGFRHDLEIDRSLNETVAMSSDLFVFIVLTAYAAYVVL